MSQQLLGGIAIPIPPKGEQRAIVRYLDERTSAIEALIVEKRAVIDHLREYRKSLISEAVTGKFKVQANRTMEKKA